MDAIPCDKQLIEQNHLKQHEGTAKKIHFTKIDPSMTFGFYLRDHKEYVKFERFMEQSKRNFGEYWIFSTVESKPKFMHLTQQ